MSAWPRRVLLKTAFNAYSGYGNDGIGIASQLYNTGWDVALLPTMVLPPIPEEVAMLLTKSIHPPYNFVLDHADPDSLGLQYAHEHASDMRIAWTMWEFLGMGPAADTEIEIEGIPKNLAKRLESYTHVFVYDEVTKTALTPYLTDQVVKKLQGGFWADDWVANPQDRNWSDTFKFCMVGALHQRKDPWVAISAFTRLKQEYGDQFDAELHLKTNIRTLHPAMEERYEGLKIHYAAWPRHVLKDFYMSCHCLLAPSWGEGKNLPALEAQTTGIPVIATNFGGHAEWLSPEFGYAVRHKIQAHSPGMGSARADEDHLVELMWHVYNNRSEARQKGEIASRVIPAQMDWSKVIERLGDLTQ